MHKKESGKAAPANVPFPEGYWAMKIGLKGMIPEIDMGILNFILIKYDDSIEYSGAIQFQADERFKRLSNRPFPLKVKFDTSTGAIHFHIVGAASIFGSNELLPLDYHFDFEGVYNESTKTINGDGGVPDGFCPTIGQSGKSKSTVGDEGEPVTWTSAGIGDPDSNSSK
ncbi:MAG TPA: hypothetical protein VFY40_06535 [Blastocatellia bacterium]|nr:hypothetical protein [Blastocatellia bacterium]